jgi:sigma-B regulation protein RsbU (phosphoserine phosphatase)
MSGLATASQGWVDDICRRASEALGWTLEFNAATDASPQLAALPLATWQSDVHDGAEVIGRLRLQPNGRESTEVDLRTAVAVAHLIAHLLGRLASVQRKLDRRNRDWQTLIDLGRVLPRENSLSSAIQRLLAAAVDFSGYWAAAFFLIDSPQAALRLRAVYGLERRLVVRPDRPLNQPGPDRIALRDQCAIVTGDDPQASHWLPRNCVTGVCVPVQTAEGPLGSLWCYDRRQRTVTEREVHVLQSFAAQMAAVLERTVLLRESAARKRLRDELQLASKRHTGGVVCPLPLDSGLDVAFRSASAAELGGDLCEVWPTGPQRTMIAVGDAVGHSIPAALIMAVARGSLRTLLQADPEHLALTDVLIRRMNQTLCTLSRAEQFMTMVIGQIDLRRMVLTYTNAGHPQPWLSRNGRWTSLQSHGLLLGIMPDAVYRRSELPLCRGDLLVFFTDGVSEAMSRDRSLFRTEGVLAALADTPHRTAAEAADAIWERLQHHMGRARRSDDQTLLVVRVRPEEGG